MFDTADIFNLPGLATSSVPIASRIGAGGASAAQNRVEDIVDAGGNRLSGEFRSVPSSNAAVPHVIEACAMDDENVALALSDGRLCHADLSRSDEPLTFPPRPWPYWEQWPAKHGSVKQLTFSPVDGALMTLENAKTAAGDQLFLGRYHRQKSAAAESGEGEGTEWTGCSIPLASSRARMAVCPCRGWAAVCTGSMANLWAVGRPGGAGRANGRGPRQAAASMEHALSVDLSDLVGGEGGSGGKGSGGAKHVALFGNTLAVATDHAVFLLAMTFHVRGEAAVSRRRQAPAVTTSAAAASPLTTNIESPSTPKPGEHTSEPQPTKAFRPKGNNPRSSRGALRQPPQQKDFPPKSAVSSASASSRAGGGSGRSKGALSGKDDARGNRSISSLSSTRRRKEGGVGGSESEREGFRKSGGGGGVLEGLVTEAEDMVVCLVHPGEEAAGGADSGAAQQPPPLLRCFDEDWKAYREREEASTEPWDIPPSPLLSPDSSPSATRLVLPVSGNPDVVDGSGRCEVLLARRVEPGEVVRKVHLLAASSSPSPWDGPRSTDAANAEHPADKTFRLVIITSKGVIVCLVVSSYSTSFVPLSHVHPIAPPLELSRSASWCSGVTVSSAETSTVSLLLPPSPTSSAVPSGKIKQRRCSGFPDVGGVDVRERERELEELRQLVFLRRCFRFTHETLLTAIRGSFLFALTVEGIQVWTFPPDTPSMVMRYYQHQQRDQEGHSEAFCVDEDRDTLLGTPRPCLLHVQELEIDGVLPCSPPSCMLAVGDVRQSVLLFPAAPQNQSTDLSFLARQQRPPPRRRCLQPHFVAPRHQEHHDAQDYDDSQEDMNWERKLEAWRQGFCGERPKGTAGRSHGDPEHASSLGLALRLGTPTEAFRRLSDGEARARRPLPATALSAFVSAAEGLHAALAEEADKAWRRVAVCPRDRDGVPHGEACFEVGIEIEAVLGGLARCWKLRRVGLRCASLVGRLLLEEAQAAAATSVNDGVFNSASTTGARIAALTAFTRACGWMLASTESVASCFERLVMVAGEVAVKLVEAAAMADSGADATAAIATDASETREADNAPSVDVQTALWKALHEHYLLPALGMKGTSISLPPIDDAGEDSGQKMASIDGVVVKIVGHLHAGDMRRLSQQPSSSLRNVLPEEKRLRGSTPLAAAIVCAGRVPWSACPLGTSKALVALEEQERALAGFVGAPLKRSRSRSNSSCSSSLLSFGFPSPRGVTTEEEDREEGGEESTHPLVEWIAAARMVLAAHSDDIRSEEIGSEVHDHVIELVCERHPELLVSTSGGIGGTGGSLSRGLLGSGRARPLVSALVRLTLRGGIYGKDGALLGPHRAQELLKLTGECFAPTIDPLQALRVFGMPGRQIAARLDSLRRVSLEASTGGIPVGAFDDSETFLQGDRDGDTMESLLQAAARDFLSQRCAASLAKGGRDIIAKEEERLSNAKGGPTAWQAAIASNRALDRAILRYLIGAHLDDLRTLEHSNPIASTVSGGVTDRDDSVGLSWPRKSVDMNRDQGSWAETILPLLLTGEVSTGRGGTGASKGRNTVEKHLYAITSLVREVTCRGVSPEGLTGGGGTGGGVWRGMTPEEASEVATEAKRRLPVTARTARSLKDHEGVSAEMDYDDYEGSIVVPWGEGGAGTEMKRSPWPWGPRAVPPSAVGAMLALAAALPASGKLLGGVEVMLQIAAEVVKAAKAEAAAAAGKAAAAATATATAKTASGAAGSKGSGRQVKPTPPGEVSSIQEVSTVAERALMLYISEYCGRDPELWASVTEHIRHAGDWRSKGHAGSGSAVVGSDGMAVERLLEALLRRCGEELGGRALVRALPEESDLVECLDEVERSLLIQSG